MSEDIDMDNNLEEPMKESKDQILLNKKKKIIIFLISAIIVIAIIIIIIFLLNNPESDPEKTKSPHIYINPKSTYKYCIIWLHGLDNKPENFVDLFTKDINIPYKDNTKIILLRAPEMNITYSKLVQTSWFDLLSFPINSTDSYNFDDAKKSRDVLANIIEEEAKLLGGHYEKIYIGGHSQGACISLYTGYNLKDLIGGVIVCSGILFPQGEIVGDKNKLNVYIGHGDKDLAIPLSFHNETIERIEDYEGLQRYYYKGHGHSISDQEKKDIENFLNETM